MAEKIIITGTLNKARREAKTFKGKKSDEKLYITISNVELSKEDKKALDEAFKGVGDKFTPSWVKDFEGYVNVASKYAIPCKVAETGEETDIETFVEENNYYNAPCRLSLTIKEGAVYPKAICIDGDGEEFNQFADFE